MAPDLNVNPTVDLYKVGGEYDAMGFEAAFLMGNTLQKTIGLT